MSSGHGGSRRRSYGRRQRDLRERRFDDLLVDMEGPAAWTRGSGWESPGGVGHQLGAADPRGGQPGGLR